ncbi:uroporphyrinogen-III C-methyltransferase [Corynebacterium bovis]|uniref:uroporphyrinogen-III C-methyltransferase n=6 Tax=Corynebacterium bovis TaxID=36808 RepID=A0A8I0CL54_9CORY|nr:uroporphyrinogen-III C-methyltransferase [Corynebacterium bovis]MBB3116232.1 uroporphyrin-III C-methyltransferase [Corynebacterium bovis DSM 20582 = CIP 54.80]RRQ14795.1 uroporphyrinogen-III C-methyltransferase [Corynebacterium bovis]
MTLRLTGVRVLVPDGPGAAVAAELMREAGAEPVVVGFDAVPPAGHPGPPPGPDVAVGLVHVPAGTADGSAEAACAWAAARGCPVDDRRGRARADRGDGGGGVGRVTLVGGGPGDPGLMTVAGARAVAEADVVLTDHLGPVDLAAEAAARGAEVVDVAKIPYGRQVAQERINELMVERARAGLRVVRLKGGDPFVFGRGFEEVRACEAAGVPVTVVPGVTSATAAPALAGLSLTHRGLNHDLTVVSGHVPPGHPRSLVDWGAVAAMRGTTVLIMAVRNARAIAAELVDRGMDAATPAVVVENASTEGERVTESTLARLGDDMDAAGVRSPAVIVVGAAAGERAVPADARSGGLSRPGR